MYLTVKQQLNHLSKDEYKSIQELCHIAKNLTNEAIYNIRQYYFAKNKYLCYQSNYAMLKHSTNYKMLNSNISQQILKEVDGSFKSFFKLIKLAKQGKYDFKKCKLPHYLPKDGYTTLVIGFVRLKNNKLIVPFSNTYKKEHSSIEITIPPILLDKQIKEIRIIPKANARFFEIQYTYEAETIQRNLNKNNALAIDFGVDNFATAVSNTGKTFIVDGKKIKSVNQWFNKENARLQSIKDKQNYGDTPTVRQQNLAKNRNNRINDYTSKTTKYIINYCIENNIGNLVVGYNDAFQSESSMGRQNNQNFVNIPFGKLKNKLEYLCELNNIQFIEQEESYTSKASFFDMDTIPVYDEESVQTYTFSGKRVKRGLYKTASGMTFNADVNGALNILRKSNVVSLDALYTRGAVDTPVRIRIA